MYQSMDQFHHEFDTSLRYINTSRSIMCHLTRLPPLCCCYCHCYCHTSAPGTAAFLQLVYCRANVATSAAAAIPQHPLLLMMMMMNVMAAQQFPSLPPPLSRSLPSSSGSTTSSSSQFPTSPPPYYPSASQFPSQEAHCPLPS